MSMSLFVVGLQEKDEQFRKMKKILDLCNETEIEPPDEVTQYFLDLDWGEDMEYGSDDDHLFTVKINSAVFEWNGEEVSGLQVELARLPKNVTHLRFYLMW
jgi:hypothetical protein